jgi:hypothetical protein
MTVRLPLGEETLKVRVRIVPTGILFDSQLEIVERVAHLTLFGTLNEVAAPIFKTHLEQIMAAQPEHVVLHLADLQTIASGSARALGFVVEKLDLDKEVYVEGANAEVQTSLQNVGVWEELNTENPLHLVQSASS